MREVTRPDSRGHEGHRRFQAEPHGVSSSRIKPLSEQQQHPGPLSLSAPRTCHVQVNFGRVARRPRWVGRRLQKPLWEG